MGSHRAAKEMVGRRFGVADVSYLVRCTLLEIEASWSLRHLGASRLARRRTAAIRTVGPDSTTASEHQEHREAVTPRSLKGVRLG
jgi:hypothetical protein